MINEVYQKKIDVIVSPLTIKSPRHHVISFLPPLYQEIMVIAISSTAVLESWDFATFFRPLHYSLWVAILITVVTISVMKAIFLERKIQLLFESLKYFWDSTLPVFGGASTDLCMGRISSYILLITSLLNGYIVWISYNAALTSELMTTEKTYPFKDLESVSSTNWKYDNLKETLQHKPH